MELKDGLGLTWDQRRANWKVFGLTEW